LLKNNPKVTTILARTQALFITVLQMLSLENPFCIPNKKKLSFDKLT